jgi:hypothetical protein
MQPNSPGNHAPPLTVTFPGGAPPAWPAVRDLLARRGFAVRMRMIDGQPAFPDEEPAEGWREIRVAAADGMVTVRRDGIRVAFVTWGNAGRGILQAANALAWAFAEAGAGTIDAPVGPLAAAAFVRTVDLPESLKTSPGE